MDEINRIYARTNSNGIVVKIFSEAFEKPQVGDILIDDKNTDRHGAEAYKVLDEYGVFNYNIVNGKMFKRDKFDDLKAVEKNALRARREKECFPIINRGQPWYDTLTVAQRNELWEWYKEWLDVTSTGIIPTTPSWVKR